MKQIFISTICILTLITVGAVAFSVHCSKQTATLRSQCNQWQIESNLTTAKLVDYADIVKSNQEVVATLENKVSLLNRILIDYKGELNAASDKIQTFARFEQNRQDEELQNHLPAVPEPTLIGKMFVFPKVVGIHNEILATNAAFAYLTGRRLVFRPGNEMSVVVDVDNIHPVILQYLGIDPDAAKLNQQQIDAKKAAVMQAGAVLTAQYERDQQAKREREAALAIEQEKADAAQRAAWAAQQQADVDKQKVNALIDSALNPPQINVIQQQQQIQTIQQRPIPRGYIQNNGAMIPYY